MYASQRQRRYDTSPNDPSRKPLDPSSTSPPLGTNPAVTRRKIVDGYDLAAGEGAGRDDFEMQPQYPNQQQFSPKGPRAEPMGFGRYEAYQPQSGPQPTLPNVGVKDGARVGVREDRVKTPPEGVPPIGGFGKT
jgi:hypothetical protein